MPQLLRFMAFAWLLVPAAGLAADPGIDEIDRCVRSNLPQKASRLRVDLECHDRSGGVWTYEGEVFWRRGKDERSETLIKVEAPPDDRGTLYLSHSSEDRTKTWVCLPELKRVRSLAPGSTEGKLLCTDISSEDIQHM
jgi:hypothetical protein